MTREELENKIAEKLWEIQEMIRSQEPPLINCNMYVDHDSVTAFTLERDENGEGIPGKTLLDVFQMKTDWGANE